MVTRIDSGPGWTDYELIDSGDREKLERFGNFVLTRPEPQAVWPKAMPEQEWRRMSHARYTRAKGSVPAQDNTERGAWERKPVMPDQWSIVYRYDEMRLTFRLGLTSFGHIGVFPEQAESWNLLYDWIRNRPDQGMKPKVLNLFAYTGGASLAARAAGAEVVHVDSVKPVITWAREIMTASGLDNIRWVVEDAMNFVRREVKRGNRYDAVILDPPAYGRGPDGEKWVLADSISEMIRHCSELLVSERGLFMLSLYSMGFSPLIGENLAKAWFRKESEPHSGEFVVTDRAGRRLPLGTYTRLYLRPEEQEK